MPDTGFKPIIGGRPEILILGSMPGQASLAQSQYYANPRNLFWQIIADLFNFNHHLNYEQKIALIIKNKIALWDVIESCERPGSLDASICSASIKINNFEQLFSNYPSISHVFFNGKKAEKEFHKRVLPKLSAPHSQLDWVLLPSTSPANAGVSRDEKIIQWSKLKLVIIK